MKTTKYFIALLLVTLLIACKSNIGDKTGTDTPAVSQDDVNQATESAAGKKYGIKSGIVTFEIDMMGEKQRLVLYFDDFGAKEAEEQYEGEKVESISLCDGKDMYTIIPRDNTAYTRGSCYRGVAYRFAWDEISEEDQNTKAKKLANMTIAGMDCESFSYDMGTSVTVYAGWKNICLYQKTISQSVEVIKKAINLEEDAVIPSEKFQVPSGFEMKQSGF